MQENTSSGNALGSRIFTLTSRYLGDFSEFFKVNIETFFLKSFLLQIISPYLMGEKRYPMILPIFIISF
mgnify:CR=1 FL=1